MSMENESSYANAIKKTAHEEYIEIEEQLTAAVKALDDAYRDDPTGDHDALVEHISELQRLSTQRLQDWLDSMNLA